MPGFKDPGAEGGGIAGRLEDSSWYVGSTVARVSARSVCPIVVITNPKVVGKVI